MTKRAPQISSKQAPSSLEKLYISQFTKAQYSFDLRESKTQTKNRYSPRQISVDLFEPYQAYFALSEYQSRQGQMLSFEHAQLALPVGAYALFEQYDHQNDLGELYLHNAEGQIVQYTELTREDINTYISDYFELTCELNPRFQVNYQARLMRGLCPVEKRELWCVVEDQVSYIEPLLKLTLAQESHSRIYWLSSPPLLGDLKSIPLSSRYWMGEYHYKRLYRLPCNNELPGFEYEAKLSPDSLEIDENLLPYAVIERYQTESVRWYLPKGKGRIGFREGRASLVKKGKKTLIDGIMKRQEEKTQGLSMWTMDQELESSPQTTDQLLQMRRVKRQLYLLHPTSHRVYALCLDDCRASKRLPFHQIELEYNGKLCLEPKELLSEQWLSFEQQLKSAEKLHQTAPKAALRCLERAQLFLAQNKARPKKAQKEKLRDLLLLTQENLNLEFNEPPSDLIAQVDPKLEAEIIAEMKLVLTSLVEQQGCKPSVQTKRAWLKGELTPEPKAKSANTKEAKTKKGEKKNLPDVKAKAESIKKSKAKTKKSEKKSDAKSSSKAKSSNKNKSSSKVKSSSKNKSKANTTDKKAKKKASK